MCIRDSYAIALVGLGGDDARIACDHLGESGEPVDIARVLKFLARKSAHMLAILLGEFFFALVDLIHGFLSGSGWVRVSIPRSRPGAWKAIRVGF